MWMPEPTLFVELVAPICLSFSLFLLWWTLRSSLSHFFLIFFLISMKAWYTENKELVTKSRDTRYLLWISVLIPVLNFCYEFLSLISVTNTRFLIRKKNSGRGKVGLREMKMTERKRSEGEVVVGEAVRAEPLFPLNTKAVWCRADYVVRHI